jgi:putative nucleotidyltransferase with HDIG domain
MIPAISKCASLMNEYGMLDNIRDHSLQVARVAVTLGRAFVRAGIDIDEDLVTAGALLHDVAKTKCLNGVCNHAAVGGEICLQRGFDEVAVIVAEHVILADYHRPLSAVEIVYYADKRVRHDEIVSLDARQVYIEERYGQDKPEIIEAIRLNFGKCYDMEARIFAELDFVPGDLARQVQANEFPFDS